VDFKRINKHSQPRSRLATPARGVVNPDLVRRSMAARANNTPQPDPIVAKKPSKSRIRRFLFNKWTIITASVALLATAATVLFLVLNARDNPEYQTILPDNKSIEELGGWTRVSPPGKDPVYAYTDKINDVSIGVSQQPLPDSFKTDAANHVADLAKKYNATTEIQAGNITVYIGTSTKGPQSVIFTRDNLLVMIKSQKQIDNTAWKDYIETLGNSNSGRIPKY
jgi:hypothetical protein